MNQISAFNKSWYGVKQIDQTKPFINIVKEQLCSQVTRKIL